MEGASVISVPFDIEGIDTEQRTGENVYLLVLKNKGEIFYLLDRM